MVMQYGIDYYNVSKEYSSCASVVVRGVVQRVVRMRSAVSKWMNVSASKLQHIDL